jgi:dipeptidase E
MKLLLTSGGLRNPTLTKALLGLAAKPAGELKVAFIPTAMNTEPGDKGWAIAQLVRLQEMGVSQVDIVDVSAIPKAIWLPRLEASNVIFVNGGNTTHLMSCFNKSGLTKELPKLLQTRVYVGVSAGSYIATPDLRFNSDKTSKVLDGLSLVSFGLQAHYKSPTFPLAKSFEAVKKRVEGCPYTVYALDDQMAVKVDGDMLAVVGEGEYEAFETGDKMMVSRTNPRDDLMAKLNGSV